MFSMLDNQQELSANPLLQNMDFADSFQAKMLYHYVWQDVHFTRNDLKQARLRMEKVVFFWEENEHQIYEKPGSYLTALNNLVGIAL